MRFAKKALLVSSALALVAGMPTSVAERLNGAIGYVNQSYIRGKVKAAALKNFSGDFLKPSVAAGATALNGITLDHDIAGRNPNPSAKGVYPIATLTWVLAYEKGNGKDTAVVKEAFN